MKGRFMNGFTKITGVIPQAIIFRTKVYYEDKKAQSRNIKGPAIVVSNHTALWDFAVLLFVFFSRTVRYQMAEVLFRKKGPLPLFLRSLGGIFVDRDAKNFSFIEETEETLSKGGVVGIFPESRLPKKGEERPLPFKPSAAYIAMHTGVQVIPVFTNGKYFSSHRARVIIGTPMYAADYKVGEDEKQNVEAFNDALRQKIIELGEELDARQKK